MTPDVIDVKTLIYVAGSGGALFAGGFWIMRNLSKIVSDQTDDIRAGLSSLAKDFNERLDTVEEKQSLNAKEASEARGKIYRDIQSNQMGLMQTIRDLEKDMNDKFVRTETLEVITAGQAQLYDSLGAAITDVSKGINQLAQTDSARVGHAKSIADDVRRGADALARKVDR